MIGGRGSDGTGRAESGTDGVMGRDGWREGLCGEEERVKGMR